MFSSFNWLAILVSALAGMFIGFLWYGLFFEPQWSEGVGFVVDGETFFKHGKEVTLDPVTPMIINFVTMVVYAIFFSWLTRKTASATFMEGATLGAITGAMVAIGHYVTNTFAMEPTVLSLIDGSYFIVLFAVIGAITAGWRKKVTA